MNIVTDVASWRELSAEFRKCSLGLIPTMGHLHAGHVSLCKRARAENDKVAVSIFVNPTQFDQAKDLARYPRSLAQDCQLLKEAGVDYVFVPDAKEMYPDQFEVQVSETKISQVLEGEFRPGHFTGMLTVVLKLLNIISPTRAYFGEKDYQQLLLVKKMVNALFLPIEIIACPTIRSEEGLALSSRNSRLNAKQKERAIQFAQILQHKALPYITPELETLGLKVDYVVEEWGRRLAAIWVDDVRLIDNIEQG